MSDFIVVSGLPPFTPCQNYQPFHQPLPHPSEWRNFIVQLLSKARIRRGGRPANFSVFRVARRGMSKTCALDPGERFPL
ncbi:hypothetical protein [Burkholderia ubonensis]|uniref:hypothetical protein n=1 Tax=Burkholderia ubonensis TaxID=101571 RepID=UPI000B02E17D|nr:hypothetical protein [Burkholderia ubonensis]